MIRLIYWIAILLEFLLLLAVLFIFIITDARTIKVLAKESLVNSKFEYKKIEGNFFTGLQVEGLSYNKKPLFDSATLYWNPMTLLNKEITLQEVNIKGVEVENILDMVDDFKSGESSSFNLLFSIIVNNIHLDINPYVFEGVKFSSFLFESDKIKISKELLIDGKDLYLYFDSDLVNVKLKGDMRSSKLFVDFLALKEIDAKAITKLVKRLKRKSSKKVVLKKANSSTEPFIKKIKIKRIVATLKDVTYNPLSIYKTKVFISNGEIDPFNHYSYKVKRVQLIGNTNFGKLNYKGYVKNSTIYAKGSLELSKELFNRYSLPLNFQTLKKLKGTLKLNHEGVWLETTHQSKKLLKIESDFNLDVLKSQHKLHYDYSDNRLTIDSKVKGKMPYADIFKLKNRVVVDQEKGFEYMGSIEIPKVKGLPTKIVERLRGEFKGDSRDFDIKLDSKFVQGDFKIDNYKSAVLKLKSKENRVSLHKILPIFSKLPSRFKYDKIMFDSKTFLDFKNFKASYTLLNLYSNIVNLDVKTALTKPFTSTFSIDIPSYTLLQTLDQKINFSKLKSLKGTVDVFTNSIDIKVKNKNLSADFEYDMLNKMVSRGLLSFEGHKFFITPIKDNNLALKSKILNLEQLLNSLKKYYKVNLPQIEGSITLDVKQRSNGSFRVALKSPHLKYFSGSKEDEAIFNLYNVDILFIIDKNRNIEIPHYAFKTDDNEYESRFYSTKKSYLTLKSNSVVIKKLWINNEISIDGEYNFSTSKGELFFNTESFAFRNKDFDFIFNFALKLKIIKSSLSLSGNIDILGNSISYEVVGSNIVEDSDIIIVRDESVQKESALKNLILDLKINSPKPLKYISKDTNIEFFNDLCVIKKSETDNIIVTGMSTITKGYYQIEDKKFTLDESHIYFAGDPKKPLLDIKADYKKDEYLIHIFISGSTDEPIVNFTAEPYLTQQEILSLILFDGTGTSDGGGAEAYTLLGGTFAKGLIKSLGIDVDHLRLGTDTNDKFSFEIGRRVSKDVTVMYQHEDGKDGVKVRVEHNKNFETDIIIQPPNSSSIEFLYKYSE